MCFRIRDGVADIPLLSHDDLENCTPGNSIIMEAKLDWNSDKIKQLIATTVVASFTERLML